MSTYLSVSGEVKVRTEGVEEATDDTPLLDRPHPGACWAAPITHQHRVHPVQIHLTHMRQIELAESWFKENVFIH